MKCLSTTCKSEPRRGESAFCLKCVQAMKATNEAQVAEIAELKDEVENLNGELMFRPRYGTLTERIAELEAENKCLAEIRREVINTAIGWQDEENCCPSECNHTEVCAEEILNLVMPQTKDATP